MQQNATATIIAENGKRMVTLGNPPKASGPIAEGATLQAAEPGKGLAAIVTAALGNVTKVVEEATTTVKGYFDRTNADWQKAKQSMQDLANSIARQSETAGDQVQDELSEFLRALESKSYRQAKQVQALYQDLKNDLAKQQETLKVQGKTEAVSSVQELSDKLKSTWEGYQQQAAANP